MKIGAHISVRNEIGWIGRVLRYHLDVQGFDFIVVNDDASYDGTTEAIKRYAEKDRRVIPIYTPQKKGFTQSSFSVAAMDILFNKMNCDFVLPIDADEFWYSESCPSVRESLKLLPKEKSMLVTYAYDFLLTERDDNSNSDVIDRQFYCRVHDNPKAVFCKSGGCVHRMGIGNHAHTVVFKKNNEVPVYKIPASVLCRFHYRIGDKKSFFAKVMNQVEGYIISTQGEWLHDPRKFGSFHIWHHYMRIRDGGLDEEYNRLIVGEKSLSKSISDNKIFYKDCLKGLVPENPYFIQELCESKKNNL